MNFITNNNLDIIDIYPISIFFVEVKDRLILNSRVSYSPSKFYQTEKMRCMYSYKPSLIV